MPFNRIICPLNTRHLYSDDFHYNSMVWTVVCADLITNAKLEKVLPITSKDINQTQKNDVNKHL